MGGFGSVSDFLNFGATTTVNCNTGYILENITMLSVTCQADRTIYPMPRCVGKLGI